MNNQTKLKVAAEEIKEILRKHDIAAAVVLHAPGHGEHFMHLTPSYSCAYMYNDNEIRIYSKKEDYNNVEEQQQKQAYTSNMLSILTDITAINFMGLETVSKMLDKKLNAKHTPLKRT